MKSLSVTDFFNLHTVQPFPKPAGLHNLGNTCFFNAAIQCLIRIQPLTAFVMSPTFESHINFNNPLGSHGAIALAYRNFLMDICGGRNNTRDPRLLRSAIASKYRKFANYWQQDSQELLGALLDGLHEDLNQAARPKNSTENETVSSNADSWSLYLSKNSSPIMDLFSGKLYSRINCNLCGYSSIVHELFMFLSLSVPSRAEKSIKLIDCIKFFLKEEQLDESNKWKCEKCNHYVKATKKIEIEQCPPVLIIHLKRFEGRLRYATKIDTTVDYPDELDASLFTMKKNNDVYRLIGVVFHAGGLNGGHYTSAALDLPSGQWYYFNDSSASKISIAAAHNSKAYILFYQRK
ncbi:Clan CA, family C19, ubiquitin hydrolase-like cysteine peptidase [Histomonas meleagridis]|uniref:Clan CA, family C19, ubiquitin hydrolase-like cysteine peptidase n=1 Tax=Histomonas meleagridis TaxID=135588 RepID=UPI00355A5756|nr:Clan CA, family C19, ubiquitin hydrolase-like cysteine peptidase [Histomonas meleagridis]KAH0804367.1 Clan CA, family C19, ubiquitin hydrolase-like cysteine peptidase [Histomonas meleagridis]